MTLTFEGAVDGWYDAAELKGDIEIGSAVTYTFVVDRAMDGEGLKNNGSSWELTDSSDTDYFYVDFLGDTLLTPVDNGYYAPMNTGTAVFNYGFIQPGAISGYNVILYGGSTDHLVSLLGNYDAATGLFDTNWLGYEKAYNGSGYYTQLESSLTMTGQPTYTPVPEPATLLLMGIGGFGLMLSRRRG